MFYPSSQALTKQFYEWEYKGRGHTAVGFPAELEPPFIPFFGHVVHSPYIDDGKRHTVFSKLKGHFVPEHTVTVPVAPTQDVIAFPDSVEPLLTLYKIIIPKNYTCKADSIEHCLNMLFVCKVPLSFELIATHTEISVHITCRCEIASFVYAQLKAYFADCVIQKTDNDEVLNCAEAAQSVYVVDFGLQEEFMRPMATYSGGSHDPYTPLFGTFEQLQQDQTIIVQVLFCGTQNPWAENIIRAVSDERGGSFFADAPEMSTMAKEKTARPLFAATIRMAAFAEELNDAATLIHYAAIGLMQASVSTGNKLMPLTTPDYTIEQRLSDLVLRQSHRVGMLLNTKELATFVHFPSVQLSKKLLADNRTTKRAPSYLLHQSYTLGINNHQGQSVAVGIDIAQRLKHLHILGATGMGKSTLLHSLILHDIANGIGCCVLDPHGDLIEALLPCIPVERINDVVVIDPSDSEFPVGFNILSAHTELERELLASDLVALFKRFSTSWGDQLHSVLANAIMALLYNTKAGHIGDLRKFLIEPQFRKAHLQTCTDSELVYYWQKEYPLLKTSSIGSILTRLDSFLRPKVIRNMVCQHKGLDIPALMDSNKIILVKLSQGLIGVENSYLLGAVIVAKLQQAAMSRQLQSRNLRTPFFCYIDEFHHFITPSMNTILSGARKYSLGLVLVHQDMQQIQRNDTDIASSLMANVGTRICFRLSDTDAKRMQEGFTAFTATDLQNLSVGDAIARVNTADADFNLTVQQLEPEEDDYTEDILAASRTRYSVPILPPVPLQDTPEPIAQSVPEQKIEPPIQPIQDTQAEPPPIIANTPPSPQKKEKTRNNQEHLYLQSYIKTMAEQHGYRAAIEVPTPDGTGLVDVVLEKENEHIAVEVSVSTGADWELHNIQKCLRGNYTKIVVCTNTPKKLQQINERIGATLTVAEQSRVVVLPSDEIVTLFTAPLPATEKATIMKGYRVKVNYEAGNRATNEDIIKRIITGAKK